MAVLAAVAVAAGAIPEWLMPDAALLVPPSDPPALAAALRAAIGDPELRRRLRMGALRLRAALPSWSDAVLAVERALLAAAATPLADGTPRPSARMVRAASLTG